MIEEKLTLAHTKKFPQTTITTTKTIQNDNQTSLKSNSTRRTPFNAKKTKTTKTAPTKRRILQEQITTTTTATTTNHLLTPLSIDDNKSFRNRLENHTNRTRHLKHIQDDVVKENNREEKQQQQHMRLDNHRQAEALTCFNLSTSGTNKLNVYNNNNNSNNTSVTSATTTSSTMTSASSNFQWCWLLSSVLGGLLRRPSSTSASLCLTLLVLTTTCSLCSAGSLCESQSWWNPHKDKCIPCTVCQGDMIPLRPCQMHRDTVCGSIYDLKIDWVVLSKTEPNWKEVSGKFAFRFAFSL